MSQEGIWVIVIGGMAILVALIIGGIQIYQGKIQISLSRNHKSFPIQINIKSRNTSKEAQISSNVTDSLPLEINITPEILEKDRIYRKDILPDIIFAELKKYPPYQIAQVLSNYIGLKVEWDLLFYNIRPYHDKFRVSLDYNNSAYLIFINIDITEYPELKIAHKGTKINIKGTISEVDPPVFLTLKDVKINITQLLT
jgi:hypothetical protein